MLSKYDIEKELMSGGINVVPFEKRHLKENSYNLTASEYAWTMTDGKIYYDKEEKSFSVNNLNGKKKEINIKKGRKAVYENQIVILPHSTTLIETKETIAVENNIGGTYHSKVGMVNLGLGHIGTMLGPNYCGQSLIALHNITDDVISIEVGISIVSVAFNYLETPIEENNPTQSGHTEKFSNLGIHLSKADERELNADWKRKKEEIKSKMKSDPGFVLFKEEYDKKVEEEETEKEKSKSKLKKIFSKKNVILAISVIVIAVILFVAAYIADSKLGTNKWRDRAWTVLASGVIITVLQQLIKKIE